MKTKMNRWSCWGLLAAVVGLAGCGTGAGTGAAKSVRAPSGHAQPGAAVPQPESAVPMSDMSRSESLGAPPAPAAPAAAPPTPGASMSESAPKASSDRSYEEAPSVGERPGLGTEWGETRYSHVNNVSFDRADPSRPSQVVSLYYNDREGARAMARYADYREVGNAVVRAPSLGISISLNDDSGRPLPAFYAGGHTYAIGEAGQRYTIVVSNETGVRVEAVASVDGLDVLDGLSADFAKRGYLVPQWGSVEIDGFRQSNDQVAAFRFGSVRDSYAARTGSDRNVGVIGVAVFSQRGAPSWPWTQREVERRKSAEPFPGRYASPPPRRW